MNPCNSVSAALRLRLGLRPIKNRYMSIDFQVNLNQPLNFTAVILAHATLRLRYATPQSRQSPDGSFLKK